MLVKAIVSMLFENMMALKVYPMMRSVFVDIIKTSGFRDLYAGLSPSLVETVLCARL
ncbi:unnamed protein product [Dovyalis caffra]|uniref:Uncharacterized protein n=1 Tax=Dovyalis caffra TaxID=77055 RepID=A0AAV1S8W3_9ROSI|nr:unnamed protein product [Dovyalis caffra]